MLKFYMVAIVVIACLAMSLVFNGRASRQRLPNFSNWTILDQITPDIDKDGQPDLCWTSYSDKPDPLGSDNNILTYSLLKNIEDKTPDLAILFSFVRDQNCPQQDGAYLIKKLVVKFYVHRKGRFCLIQQELLSRPSTQITNPVEEDIFGANSPFKTLLAKMYLQAGVPDKAINKKMPAWTWYPEEPAK